VVHLVRPARAERADEGELVVGIRLDQLNAISHAAEVWIARAASAHDTKDLVSAVEQQLGEEGAVLAPDSGYERAPRHSISTSSRCAIVRNCCSTLRCARS